MPKDGLHGGGHGLVGHGKLLPSLGVPDQDVACGQAGQHLRTHLSGAGAGILIRAVLGAKGNGNGFLLHQCLHGP